MLVAVAALAVLVAVAALSAASLTSESRGSSSAWYPGVDDKSLSMAV